MLKMKKNASKTKEAKTRFYKDRGIFISVLYEYRLTRTFTELMAKQSKTPT